MWTYEELERVVKLTGLWDGHRRQTHSFVLSNDVYRLDPDQYIQINNLAAAIHRSLQGVSRLMAIAGQNGLHRSGDTYQQLHKLLSKGTAYKLTTVRPATIPLMAKVDLVVDDQDKVWIAEIDACNPRSLGYSIVGRMLAELIAPGSDLLPGVVGYLARELRQQKTDRIVFLYGDTQRFYEPEFQILAAALRLEGIDMTVINETEVSLASGVPVDTRDGRELPGWYMDFPLLNRNAALVDWLKAAAQGKLVNFVVPPKHFLGSKALLAVLSNATLDRGIEVILETQITTADIELLRQHLPETRLVGKGSEGVIPEGYMLKKIVSSGAKGVWFPDEREFAQACRVAAGQDGNFVAQQIIPGRQWSWRSYDAPDQECHHVDWQLRLTAYCSREGVKDIAITACRDAKVHGGSGAIVTGTVLA